MNIQREIDNLIAEHASQWLETLQSGDVERYPGFVRWVGESPRHMREFMALLALKRELPGAFARAGIDRGALLERVAARSGTLVLAMRESLPPRARARERRPALSRRVWLWGVAATVVLMLGSAAWVITIQGRQTFTTAVGEQRTVTLGDGSLMSMNAHSRVRVRFQGDSREIELAEGEALFQVAHDRQRPFRVHTRDAVVRAVGTRFNVNARPTRTVVSVLEGKVEISTEAAPQARPGEPLSAGEAAEVTREGKVERRSPANADGATAWRQRQLVFAKTPLEDVAAEFNRFHEKGRLVLENVVSGSHHYTGTFSADDVASFAAMLGRQPDLTVEMKGGDYVVRGMPSP